MDTYRPLDSFASVGEGQTAVVALQPGPTYDEIHLEFPYSVTVGAEFTSAHIAAVRLNLNGEDIVDVKGTDLVMLEAYEGNAEQNGYLTLSLKEIIAKSFDGSHMTGLVTVPGDALSLEVDILGTGASAVVTLKGFATTSPSRPARVLIPKLRRFPFTAGAGGDFEITTLPRGPRVKRIHFDGANVANVIAERDQLKLYDLSKARAEYNAKRFGRVPQANWFHFDPIVDGYAAAKMMITKSTSLVFRLNMSDAGSAHALVESVWGEQPAYANETGKRGRRAR